jgi:RNA polymerase sigma factor (sigma-70 family)
MSPKPHPTPIDHLLEHVDWLRLLSHHVVSGEHTADLAQDTWVAALRSPPDPHRPARPWLAQVLRNFARRRGRDDKARAARERAAVEFVDTQVPTPETLLDRAEAQRLLVALVVGLAEPYRSTVLLRYYEGLSAVAIATAHHVPEGTVRWRLKEALKRLRSGLDARYDGTRAWSVVLVPLALEPAERLALLKKGLLMAAKSKATGLVAALALLVLAGSGVVAWRKQIRPPGPLATVDPHTHQAGPMTGLPRPVLQAWQEAGATAGSVAGVVLDPEGRPAARAQVALVVPANYQDLEDKTSLRPRASGEAGADGRFRFANVGPGLYLVTATAKGWSPALRTDVALLPGRSVEGLELRLKRGGIRLSGRVSDAGGGIIAGAALRALAMGAGGRPDGSRTFLDLADDQGAYEMVLPRGSYRLAADADGYGAETTQLRLDLPRTQDFFLKPAARISGRVIDEQENPIAGAEVRIESDAVVLRPSRASITRQTLSNAEGVFAFSGVPPGSFRVSARSQRLVARTFVRVIVSGGDSADQVVVVLGRGRSISGVLRDPGGGAVVGGRLRVGEDLARAISGPDGRYLVEGLAAGRHQVLAEAAGYGQARLTVVVGAADLQNVDLTLAAAASVLGRVVDGTGRPLGDVSVTALVATPDALADTITSSGVARTDAAGRFNIGGLGPGELRVHAEHFEAGTALAGPFPLVVGQVKNLELRMGQGGVVRGRVVWDDKSPAVAAVVTGSQRRGHVLTTVTDEQGRYQLGPFPAGEVVVDARPEPDALERGGTNTEKRVSLGPAEDKEAAAIVLPRRQEEIAGTIFEPDGKPLPGATVGIARPHRGVSYRPYNKYAGEADGPSYTVLSDAAGAFTLQHLPKGSYDVWATHPNFPEADVYAVVSGTRTVQVQFTRGGRLAGRVVDGNGAPVDAYTVTAQLSHKNESSAQLQAARGYVQAHAPVQDRSGRFQLVNLHPALYDVLVTTADGRGGRLGDVSLSPGETRDDLRVVIDNPVKLAGHVLDEMTRKPLAGVTVVAAMALFVNEVRGVTSADGSFLLDGIVPGGQLSLVIRGDGRTHGVHRRLVPVPAGKSVIDVGTLALPVVSDPRPVTGR